jgi:tetratricopeptide (TPR) repeat protein
LAIETYFPDCGEVGANLLGNALKWAKTRTIIMAARFKFVATAHVGSFAGERQIMAGGWNKPALPMFLATDQPFQEDTMKHRSEALHRLGLLAGAIVLSIGTACILTPAMAAGESGSSGGGSGGGSSGGNAGGGSNGGQGGRSSNMTTCPRGQIYSERSRRCVQVRSEILTDEAVTDYAYALAQAERFDEALETLNMVQNPNTPKALNYRGYITRKLGRTEEGIGYYLQSVALDPKYPQVREYLGEAYVVQGKVDLAREQLQVIQTLCGTECEEYRDLAEAIEAAPR